MNKRLDKNVATVLALLMLALPATLSARQRRGANLVVTLKDGRSVTGELITVKPDSLLLLSAPGKDESIGIADINTIVVYKKRKSIGTGVLIGAVGLGLAGYVLAPKGEDSMEGVALVLGVLGGALVGGLVGMAASGEVRDKEFVMAGQPQESVKRVLVHLSYRARIFTKI